ncbi:methionine synthase [Yinghuangia sp. ASG 101]|uniref:methionine synthase n=1 Tax=Yinghuangia sp. ASG 101 TaxID=2896848 RepID=UPI001E5A0753|nr:methionine synthase [Yinghuangia sp. ASG 101]UGQ15369.1 methionine synthase [Yinghuangia sp. ASG 101]
MSAEAGATESGAAYPWPVGSATGVGSVPGGDVREAVRLVVGELAGFPHLPELPQRGVGADLIGRSAGVLVDLFAEVQPSGWRFADRPGRDHRRAVGWLREDLDALEEFTQGYAGALKVQLAGPWTLAASIELTHGDKALADPGACRDLAESLAEGVRAHVAEVRRRVPGAGVVLQIDEPALPGVLAGAVPTASGFGKLRAVDKAVVREGLRTVIGAAGVPVVVHSCAAGVPIGLLREVGAKGVSLDFSLLRERDEEEIGEAVEAGLGFLFGVVPSLPPPTPSNRVANRAATRGNTGTGARPLSDPAGTVRGVKTLWRRLGFRPEHLGEAVVVTPTCGLAGADPAWVRRALAHSVEAARVLHEAPEG